MLVLGSLICASSRAELPAAVPVALKELAWMVGEWRHESEGALITMTARWSENGHFLLREFKIRLGQDPPLKVQQTIYWDPVEEELHSAGFLGDGSVERGSWMAKDGQAHNQRRLMYSDGTQGSAINTWQQVDEEVCVFSSTARVIDGEKVPDIAEHELQRQ